MSMLKIAAAIAGMGSLMGLKHDIDKKKKKDEKNKKVKSDSSLIEKGEKSKDLTPYREKGKK